MNNPENSRMNSSLVVLTLAALMSGCGGGMQQKNRDFFTSGNREADQRADTRMAKSEQAKGAAAKSPAAPENLPLFQRLGGEAGLTALVDDFVTRALADPRVNFRRLGVMRGGIGFQSSKLVTWNPNPAQLEQFKKHVRQFLTLATGGPAYYDGQEMKAAHKGLRITNEEFDGAAGDLKATMDKLQVPVKEQKELLSIVESTRTQVVEQR